MCGGPPESLAYTGSRGGFAATLSKGVANLLDETIRVCLGLSVLHNLQPPDLISSAASKGETSQRRNHVKYECSFTCNPNRPDSLVDDCPVSRKNGDEVVVAGIRNPYQRCHGPPEIYGLYVIIATH